MPKTDGDKTNGTITVDVKDDGPVAVNDSRSVDESQTITGNVVSNNDYGSDGAGLVLSVNGQSVGSNGLTINGQYGTLTIQRRRTHIAIRRSLTIQMLINLTSRL